MNPTSKKFISLFLVVSLLAINCATFKRREEKREKGKKHGAILIIQKIDGQQMRGELITVKPNSLLLLDTEGKDVSVDIADIKVIKIVKKKLEIVGLGAVIGGSIGLLCGSLISLTNSLPWKVWPGPSLFWWGAMLGGAIGGVLGVLGGGIYAFAGADKKIKIEGMTDSEIQKTMDKLRKKARIRDYK